MIRCGLCAHRSLWSVDIKLGEHVSRCFANELAELKKEFSAPMNSVETTHVQVRQ